MAIKGPKLRRSLPKLGDIFRIPLEDGYMSLAQYLPIKEVAFFDVREREFDHVDDVSQYDVLFRQLLYDSALKHPRWQIIGNAPIRPEFIKRADKVMQDITDPRNINIMISTPDGVRSERSSYEAAKDLEIASVADIRHVEERLNNHYAGWPDFLPNHILDPKDSKDEAEAKRLSKVAHEELHRIIPELTESVIALMHRWKRMMIDVDGVPHRAEIGFSWSEPKKGMTIVGLLILSNNYARNQYTLGRAWEYYKVIDNKKLPEGYM